MRIPQWLVVPLLLDYTITVSAIVYKATYGDIVLSRTDLIVIDVDTKPKLHCFYEDAQEKSLIRVFLKVIH